jgi:hypothetical protein
METRDNLPRLFIGSSSKGLEVAEYLQVALESACQVAIWNQSESLVKEYKKFHFAAFVITPDDIVVERDNVQTSRETILLQMGLFIGSLGRERTFIVYCADDPINLPPELRGVTPATFRRKDNVRAAVNPAAMVIKGAIKNIRDSREDVQNALRELSNHYSIAVHLKEVHHMVQELESALDVLVNWFKEEPVRQRKSLTIKSLNVLKSGYWLQVNKRIGELKEFAFKSKPLSMDDSNRTMLIKIEELFIEREHFNETLRELSSDGLYELSLLITFDCRQLLTKIDELMIKKFERINRIKDDLERSIGNG